LSRFDPTRVRRRPAGDADAAFVDALLLAGALDLLAGVPDPPRSALAMTQVAARRSGYAHDWPDARDFVVTVDREPVGRVLLAQSSDALHVVDIRLAAAWRGRGVGTALVDQLGAEADALGQVLSLTVDPGNPALRLYERAGFVPATPPHPIGGDLHLRRSSPVEPAQRTQHTS